MSETDSKEERPVLSVLVEKVRPVLRWSLAFLFVSLVITDVALYSLHQADHSRIQTLDRRVQRLEIMLVDAIHAKENTSKIEAIEGQVKSIESEIGTAVEILKKRSEGWPQPSPRKQ